MWETTEHQNSRICDQRAFPGNNYRGQSVGIYAYEVRIQESWIFFPYIQSWDMESSWPSRALTWNCDLWAPVLHHIVRPWSPGSEQLNVVICLSMKWGPWTCLQVYRTGGDGGVKIQRMDPELNGLSQVFTQYETSFNQPYSTSIKHRRLAAFHFRVLTYLGGLKNDSDSAPRESLPAVMCLCAGIMCV